MDAVQLMLLAGAGFLIYAGFSQMNPDNETQDDSGTGSIVNPNLEQQRREWQFLRRQRGEDAYDWSAFRAFLIAIGAPDPGPTEMTGFRAAGPGF